MVVQLHRLIVYTALVMTEDICVLCSLTCTWTPGLLSPAQRASHKWTIHISFLVLLQCVVCTQHSSLTFVTANCGNGKQTHNYANSSKFYCLIVSKSILIEAPTLGVSCPSPVSLDYVMEVDSLRSHQEILQNQTGCPIKTSVSRKSRDHWYCKLQCLY